MVHFMPDLGISASFKSNEVIVIDEIGDTIVWCKMSHQVTYCFLHFHVYGFKIISTEWQLL